MKIEVDLLSIQVNPALGRVAAVAILQALPVDEAQLAVDQWSSLAYALAPEDLENTAESAAPETLTEYVDRTIQETTVQAVQKTREIPTITTIPLPVDRPAVETPEPPICGATTPLKDLHPHLSNKTIGALTRAGFVTLGDLANKNPESLLAGVDRFGQKGLTELTAVMDFAGLQLSSAPAPEPKVVPTKEPEIAQEPTQLNLGLTNGHAQPEVPLRQFLRNAEHHLGRDKVVDIMQAHGVTKIAEIGAAESALRAAINEAMAA